MLIVLPVAKQTKKGKVFPFFNLRGNHLLVSSLFLFFESLDIGSLRLASQHKCLAMLSSKFPVSEHWKQPAINYSETACTGSVVTISHVRLKASRLCKEYVLWALFLWLCPEIYEDFQNWISKLFLCLPILHLWSSPQSNTLQIECKLYVCVLTGRAAAHLPVSPMPSVSQTCCAPCWPDITAFCFSSPSMQTQNLAMPTLHLFCRPPWMFSVPPLLSPWPRCWGVFKGVPFPHLLPDHLAQESLFQSLSGCLVGI